MKTLSILSLILGALPLAVYPFVVIADIMSLATPTRGDEPTLLVAVARCFQIGSLAYLPVYAFSLAATLSLLRKKGKERAALCLSILPIIYVAILTILFFVWQEDVPLAVEK
jgi:hypothetical protein